MSTCNFCGRTDELRAGCCFTCATDGERRALRRTVLQHAFHGIGNLARRQWSYARYDLTWAWERLTRTGDYQRDGYADDNCPDWRGRRS